MVSHLFLIFLSALGAAIALICIAFSIDNSVKRKIKSSYGLSSSDDDSED